MEIILIVYLVVSIALVGIILLQQGKGAEMGASFGAGAANTVFGAAGSGNVLTKTTTILAILFFAIALTISYLNSTNGPVADEVIDVVAAEKNVETKGVESELPTDKGGVAAEVAPATKNEVATETPVAEKKAVDTVKKEEAKVDTAAEKAPAKEDDKNESDN